jgi:hypothetical protein
MKPGITSLGIARLARVLANSIGSRFIVVGAKTALARAAEGFSEERPSAFEPETLLPIQYYETLRRHRELHGEKHLMFAVLQDAIDGFMKYVDSSTRKGQRRFRESEEWIDHRDKHWLYSFDNVCEALDIDPEYMRSGLHRWKQAHFERRRETAT